MAKKSTIRSNWPKWALQWGVLAALIVFLSGIAEKVFGTEPANPEALCPMGGIEAFTTYIVRGSLLYNKVFDKTTTSIWHIEWHIVIEVSQDSSIQHSAKHIHLSFGNS